MEEKFVKDNDYQKKIDDSLLSFNKEIQKRIGGVEKFVKDTELKITQSMQSLLSQEAFVDELKTYFRRYIDQEIKIKLDSTELINVVNQKVMNRIEEKYNEFISTIISKVLERMNKKLNFELEISKNLALSIDSSIREVLKNNDISYETQKRIQKSVINSLKILVDSRFKELHTTKKPQIGNKLGGNKND